MAEQEHETIWLQPWCNGCDKNSWGSGGRQWCEDDVWEPCEECGAKPVKYAIARKKRTAGVVGSPSQREGS